MYMYMHMLVYEIMVDFSLTVIKADHQTPKFNFLPNFPAVCMALLLLIMLNSLRHELSPGDFVCVYV